MRGSPPRSVLEVAFVGVVAAAWFSLFQDAMVDDAFIQLRYAETLSESGRWGFYPEQTGNTATSPLNVALLALARTVTGSGVAAVSVVAAAAVAAAFLGFRSLVAAGPGGRWLPWIGAAALVSNPLLCSTVGMESLPFAALTTLAFACSVLRRPVALGVTLGLLVLARPDGVLLAVPLAATLRPSWRAVAACAGTFALTILPWHLTAWIALGGAIPDTFFLKTAQVWDGDLRFENGAAAYLRAFPLASLLSLTLAPFAWIAFRGPGPLQGPDPLRRPVRALAAFAVLHFAAYTMLGVPPYHWYYVPEVVVLGILGSLGAARVASGASDGTPDGAAEPRGWTRGAGTAAALLGLAASFAVSYPDPGPGADPPIRPNWASVRRYREVASEIASIVEPGACVASHAEIPTIAYHCPGARFLDEFSDRTRPVHSLYLGDRRGDPVARALRRLNFAWRTQSPAFPPPTWTLRMVRGAPTRGGDPVVASWTLNGRWVGNARLELSRRAGL